MRHFTPHNPYPRRLRRDFLTQLRTHQNGVASLDMLTTSLGILGLNHLGIAVSSLDAARPYYEQVLGAAFDGEEVVEEQRVRVAFYRLGDGPEALRWELLEPTDAESPVAKFITKRGPGLHHTAYTVDDVAASLAAAEAAGLRLIDRAPRRGAHGAEIAFLHPSSTGGMLVELCRPKDNPHA